MAEARAVAAQQLREPQAPEVAKSPADILAVQEQVLRAGVRRYSLETTFDLVATTLSKVVSYDCAVLLSWRSSQCDLRVEAIAGTHQRGLERGMKVPLSKAARELFEGELATAICSDTRVSSSWLERALARAGILSSVAMALDTKGSSQKIIILGSTKTAQYRAADVVYLQHLVKVISSSLQRYAPPGTEVAAQQASQKDGSIREQQRLVSELSRGVAHSLSNVFGVLIGNLQLLEDEVDDVEVAHRLRDMQAKVIEGTGMLHALSEFSAPWGTNRREVVDLGILADEIIALTRPVGQQAPAGAIEVVHNRQEGVKAHVDRGDLEEALLNVLFNAIRALPDGGKIVVTEGCDEELAFVQVADDGVGMDAETRRRATEPFFTTRGNGAQGLGLSIASSVARKHGGYLGIISQPEETTVVRVAVRRRQETE